MKKKYGRAMEIVSFVFAVVVVAFFVFLTPVKKLPTSGTWRTVPKTLNKTCTIPAGEDYAGEHTGSATYVLIEGPNATVANTINSSIEREANNKSNCDLGNDAEWEAHVTILNSTYLSYKVSSNDYFEGAAHPETSLAGYVYDLKTGNQVSLADLPMYTGKIDQLALLLYTKGQENFLFDSEDEARKYLDGKHVFYLKENTIVFVGFQPNVVASEEIEIKNSEL